MGAMMEVNQAIFANAGQAVHVAFLVMAQEAIQDAPLRKALIRVMESIKLETGNQRNWLDQLRGSPGSGDINFAGLSNGEVRAQCAMITQAVCTKLPAIEKWVLQAKYGETEFEDSAVDVAEGDPLLGAIETERQAVASLRKDQDQAKQDFAAAGQAKRSPEATQAYLAAREQLEDVSDRLYKAEGRLQAAQVALDQRGRCRALDSGPAPKNQAYASTRRYAFSAERIAAISGLADYFAPMFPRIKPLAIDAMLGRMFANHKKIDISARDLAAQFGGDHMKYLRASWKMKNHLRELEKSALNRLTPIFVEHGVVAAPQQIL